MGAAFSSGFSIFLGGLVCFIASNNYSRPFLINPRFIFKNIIASTGFILFSLAAFYIEGSWLIKLALFVPPLIFHIIYSLKVYREFNKSE